MKRKLWLFFISFVVLISGCSSPATFSIDKEVWSGKATRTGNPDTFVRLTFKQTGENVEGALELGPSADKLEPTGQPLKGTLKGTALSLATDGAAGDSVTGTFNQDDKTFSGTLTLLIDDKTADFVLTMTYQQTQ
jgi:hypothetical protein